MCICNQRHEQKSIMDYKHFLMTSNVYTRNVCIMQCAPSASASAREVGQQTLRKTPLNHMLPPVVQYSVLFQTPYFRRLTILVMACRIIVPAFSVSFFVSPLVTQTLSEGLGCHPASLGLIPRPIGKDWSLVMRTPFARH